MRYAKTRTLDADEIESVSDRVRRFFERWNAAAGDDPIGIDDVVDELNALEGSLYEGGSIVFADDNEFLSIASACVGRGLCRFLKFEWCEVQLPSGAVLGVRNSYNKLLVPLEARVASKLSGLPDWGCLWDLIVDIYLSGHYPMGCHFLAEAAWDVDESEYYEAWKIVVPDDVLMRTRKMMGYDASACVRMLGATAWKYPQEPDWREVRDALSKVEEWFRNSSSEPWSTFMGGAVKP
jgi:hypothetical protein